MYFKELALIFLFILPFPLFSQNGEILHYTETTGFNHNTAQPSQTLFQSIASDLGMSLVQDSDGSEFNSLSNLERFDLVIFSNTSGNQGLNQSQRSNFEQYINNGGSYLGIHAASDTYRHSSANGSARGTWDWYAETVSGASVQNSPNHTANNYQGSMTFEETNTIFSRMLSNPWNKPEEYYYWQNGYLSPDFTTLLKVGQTGNNSYDAERMTAHYRELPGGGKAFYTSLGHNRSDFDENTDFGQFMKNAVEWITSGSSTSIDFVEDELLRKWNPRLQNPSENKIRLFLDLDRSVPLKMEVYDLLGNRLYEFEERNPDTGTWVWEYNLELPGGLYLVNVFTDGQALLSEKLWIY